MISPLILWFVFLPELCEPLENLSGGRTCFESGGVNGVITDYVLSADYWLIRPRELPAVPEVPVALECSYPSIKWMRFVLRSDFLAFCFDGGFFVILIWPLGTETVYGVAIFIADA